MRKRIAIFGGTFDPPHLGHVQLLNYVLTQFQLDHVFIVVAKYPPGKTPIASYEQRIAWCETAFPHECFEVSRLEQDSETTIFGIDIVHGLSQRVSDPNVEWSWILGEDQWESHNFWHSIDEYAGHICWLVYPRWQRRDSSLGGLWSRRLQAQTCAFQWISGAPIFSISSSSLREAAQKGDEELILDWVSPHLTAAVSQFYKQGR